MRGEIKEKIRNAKERLDQEVKRASRFRDMVSSSPFNRNIINYDVTGGSGHGIVKNDSISIFLSHIKKGGDFPLHVHDSSQFMYVIEGHITVVINEVEIEMKVGQYCEVPSCAPHSAIVHSDSLCLVIHRPSEFEHPEGVIELEAIQNQRSPQLGSHQVDQYLHSS